MKKFIIVLNQVEGIGTTTCAQICAEYLKDRKIDHSYVHTDPHHHTTDGDVVYLDVSEEPEVSEVVQLIEEKDAVVVDVTSAETTDFIEFFTENEIPELIAELGGHVTVVIPVNDDETVLDSALVVAEAFADSGDYLVMRTPILHEVKEDWKNSYARKALDHLGAVEMEVPSIDLAVQEELDTRGLTLGEGLAVRWDLQRYLTNELQSWFLESVEALEDAAGDLLLPKADAKGAHKSSYGTSARIPS